MNPCPYCSMPMSNSRGRSRVQCGSVECARRYNAERSRKTMRVRRAARGRDLLPARECMGCGKTWSPTSPGIFCCSRACTNVMRYGSGSELKVGRHTVSPATRLRIYERDNWTCYLCGFPVDRIAVPPDLEAPTLDHVVPLRSGGSNEVENLKTAHFYCNCVKGAKSLEMVA